MTRIIITLDGAKRVTAHLADHEVVTDQPVRAGGENAAPSPFDYFLASIGTCAGIFVKSFCDQREISAEGISIIQTVDYDPLKRIPSKIALNIVLPPDFPEKYREAVINVAELCTVKRTIADPPVFEIETSVAG